MNERLFNTKRMFVAMVVGITAFSVLTLGFVLYEANIVSFSGDLSSEDLRAAVEEHPEVKEYLESEHQNEAHFITIANIIKNDQQQQLGRTMLIATVPVLLASAVASYFVAQRLLRPVKEAYEAQERFLADAAHELRNPLATMSAVIQNAGRKSKLSAADSDKYMLQIKRQLKRMVRINEDLLFLERDVDAETKEQNISELLLDVVEDLQPHAHDKGIKFSLKIDENVSATISQRDFVRMAKNLIENAIKYSKPNSKLIYISLTDIKDIHTLTVRDTGIGIPAADLEQISERFYRASNAASQPGSGLGMSIVQKVVERQGGKLHIESIENKGTTVTVKF